MKLTVSPRQYFIIAGVAAFMGVFVLATTWPQIHVLAKENPVINVYGMGFMQLIISIGMIASGRYMRLQQKYEKLNQHNQSSDPT